MNFNANATTSMTNELFKDYPDGLLKFAAVCCVMFTLIGIPGNFITILALARFKKIHSATTIFITNLAVSDLLFSCINVPMAATVFYSKKWLFDDILCQVFPLLRYSLVAVSLLSILAITFNRYMMIVHTRWYNERMNRGILLLMIAFTWCFGFGALLPTLFGQWGYFGMDIEIGSCSILPDANGNSPKQFLFITGFLIPCLSITVCYIRIYFTVSKTTSIIKASSNVDLNQSQLNVNNVNGVQLAKNRKKIEKYVVTPPNKCTLLSFNAKMADRNDSKKRHVKSLFLESSNHLNHINIMNNLNNTAPIASIYTTDDAARYNFESSNLVNMTNAGHPIMRELLSNFSKSDDPLESQDYPMQLNVSRVNNVTSRALTRHNSAPFIHFQTKISRKPSTIPKTPRKKSSISTKDRKVFKMILAIFLAFFTCYLPITISKIFPVQSQYLFILSYLFIYLSPCVNPLIYVVISTEYRQAYKSLLCCSSNLNVRNESKSRSINS